MALEKCLECGHDISSIPEKPKKKLWLFSVVGVCVIVFFIFIGFLSTSSQARIAMTSYDCKEVGEAIKRINNPEQLKKISERCWREANANLKSWDGFCWASNHLMAMDRAGSILKGENPKP